MVYGRVNVLLDVLPVEGLRLEYTSALQPCLDPIRYKGVFCQASTQGLVQYLLSCQCLLVNYGPISLIRDIDSPCIEQYRPGMGLHVLNCSLHSLSTTFMGA